MSELDIFQIFQLPFFFIPLILGILDSRLILLPLVFLIFETWRMWTHSTGGGWAPTPQNIVEMMLKLSKVKKNEVVYDLGSGDGRIAIEAAKIGAKGVGIEIDPLRVFISMLRIKLAGASTNAKIIHGDMMKANIKDADVVVLFLSPKTMEKIETKLRRDLKKGARIVSYRFTFKRWKPVETDRENKIYLYKV